ncbi:hypothetical protein LVY75_34350 (plasmid) [Sinorhizobium sp. B11]
MFGFFKRKKHSSFSPEVQLLWSEVEKLRVRFRSRGTSIEKAMDSVSQELSRQLSTEGSFATDLILKRGWSVSDAAHMMIAEHVSAALLSERTHSDQRTAGDKAKAYLQLFKWCSERMISSGRLPAERAQAEIQAFEEEIGYRGAAHAG